MRLSKSSLPPYYLQVVYSICRRCLFSYWACSSNSNRVLILAVCALSLWMRVSSVLFYFNCAYNSYIFIFIWWLSWFYSSASYSYWSMICKKSSICSFVFVMWFYFYLAIYYDFAWTCFSFYSVYNKLAESSSLSANNFYIRHTYSCINELSSSFCFFKAYYNLYFKIVLNCPKDALSCLFWVISCDC